MTPRLFRVISKTVGYRLTLDVGFDEYLLVLNQELEKKERMISKLKHRLEYYHKKVKEEETLRATLEAQKQDESFGDVFDLKKSHIEDFGLLDD